MGKQKLIKLGVNQALVDDVSVHFEESLKSKFEEENIDYDQETIDHVTHEFLDYWAEICERQAPENWRLEQLRDELADDAEHANVGFILGMVSARPDTPKPVMKLVEREMQKRYDR